MVVNDWCVYLLRSATAIPFVSKGPGDRGTYVGITNNLLARVAAHQSGKVHSTRGRQMELVAYMGNLSRAEAACIERYLKGGRSFQRRCDFELACTSGDEAHAIYRTWLLGQLAYRAARMQGGSNAAR